MTAENSSEIWVVVHATGVRQSPSQSSALLFHAQPGREVKQCGKPVFIPDCGLRIPILPRGWIDRSALKKLGEPDEPQSNVLKEQAADDSNTYTEQSTWQSWQQQESHDWNQCEQMPEQQSNDWSQDDGWWQQRGYGNQRSTNNGEIREKLKREAVAAWQDQTGTEHQESKSYMESSWYTPWHDDRMEASANSWEQNWKPGGKANHAWSGGATNGPVEATNGWRPPRAQPSGQESRPVPVSAFSDAQLRFSGRIKFTDEPEARPMIASAEVAHIFGIGSLEPAGPWPDDLQPSRDQIVCFAVEDGSPARLAKVVPGSLCRAAVASRFVGTVKAVNQQKNTAWISCLAAQQMYGCDVYLYLGVGMGVSGASVCLLRHGDVVGFSIHVNAKGKPQASTGSVALLRSIIPGRSSSDGGAGMDATVLQVGQVVSVGYSQRTFSQSQT